MISAFENCQLQVLVLISLLKNIAHMVYKQEVKFCRESSTMPSQLNRLKKEGLLDDQEPKAVVPPVNKSLRDFNYHSARNVSGRAGNVSSDSESSQASKQLSSTVPLVMSRENGPNTEVMSGASLSEQAVKELKKLPTDPMRQFTSETAIGSGRMTDEHSQENWPYKIPAKSVKSSESSVAEGSGRGRGDGLKSSNMIMASNLKRKTLEYYKEKYYPAQSPGMWIFPDNTKRLRITFAGKQVLKIVDNHNNEARTSHQANKMSSEIKASEKNVMHEAELNNKKKQKNTVDQPEPGSGSSPDDLSNGLVGQVIKFAVIIGFGLLILLTRQKEPRKKHVPEYVDDRTLKPWTGKQ